MASRPFSVWPLSQLHWWANVTLIDFVFCISSTTSAQSNCQYILYIETLFTICFEVGKTFWIVLASQPSRWFICDIQDTGLEKLLIFTLYRHENSHESYHSQTADEIRFDCIALVQWGPSKIMFLLWKIWRTYNSLSMQTRILSKMCGR